MLSPSTAPRWKRQTKTGRPAWGGKGLYEVNTARARNSGSRPTLNKARPPDFTKTLLEIDTSRSSNRCPMPPLPPIAAQLLPLKLRPSKRQSDRQRARLLGITDIRQLPFDHLLRIPRHRPTQDRKSTRLNSSHPSISYAVFCLKKKKKK